MKVIRALLAVGGLLAVGHAVLGAAGDPTVAPIGHLTFLVSVLIVHDALVLPVAIGIGALARRVLPRWARVPVQAALAVSAIVTLVALPFVLGRGRSADVPSALPLNYGRGLLTTLATVWTVTGLVLAARRISRSSMRSPRPPAR